MITTYTDLVSAETSIAGTDKTLLVASTISIAANDTIPVNIKVIVEKGGCFSIASGITLTINGSFECGLHQCFSGSGTVVFGNSSIEKAYPQWWGAKGDGTTDDTTAIQKMFTVFNKVPFKAYFARGTYPISTTLTWYGTSYDVIYLYGEGMFQSALKWVGAAGGTMMTIYGGSGTLSQLGFYGNNTALIGCFLEYNSVDGAGSYSWVFDYDYFEQFTGVGSTELKLGYTGNQVSEVNITNCTFQGNNTCVNGIYFGGNNAIDFYVTGSHFSDFETAINHSTGGRILTVNKCTFAGNSVTDINSQAVILSVIGSQSEHSALFLLSEGSVNPATHFLAGNFFYSGAIAADEYIIKTAGSLTLINNMFVNYTTEGVTIPKIGCDAYSTLNPSTIVSIGNFYATCDASTLPFYSISGAKDLWNIPQYETSTWYNTNLYTFGDHGGTWGATSVQLPNGYRGTVEFGPRFKINGVYGDYYVLLTQEEADGSIKFTGSASEKLRFNIATENTGTTGGLKRHFAEAAAAIEADASTTITLSIPSGARLLGCQLRVDVALAAGELWDAAYSGGSTTAIATAQAVAKNTKVNLMYNDNAATAITSNTTNIAITKNGGGNFTAQGTIRAIVYYETFTAMADA